MVPLPAEGLQVKHAYLRNFRSLDVAAFEALMRHLGFAAAACYRWRDSVLVQVLATDTDVAWPAAVELSFNYTSINAGMLPLGWSTPGRVPATDQAWRNLWPKHAALYFPVQDTFDERVLIGVVPARGKRLKYGELSGALEALCARLRGFYQKQVDRNALNELGFDAHVRSLGSDLRRLIDHELRTPLASIAGYASLLKELNHGEQRNVAREYWQIMDTQLDSVMEAVEKLSLALKHEESEDDAMTLLDAESELQALCDVARQRGAECVGEEALGRLNVRFMKNTDQPCLIRAHPTLFRRAVWEVLKNAMSHTRTGRVEVALYASNDNMVIDILDDGVGVSSGAEELIFSRFYQDPHALHARSGKRGLGLGLYLARHIAERHVGRLTLVRQRSGTLFRFVWPRATGDVLSKGA